MSDPRPVFISYARDASREHAEALYKALGPEAAFLDTEAIGVGDPLPERLVDALFAARVVVIFAEPGYFTRRYCLYEFNVACEPFLRLLERPDATDAEKEAALRGIVLALPLDGKDPMLDRFPPRIQGINWPRVDDVTALARLVHHELATSPPTLRERYQAIGDDAAERAKLVAATRLPTPLRIGNIPVAPAAKLPPSIHDAFVGRADDLWRIHHVLTTRSGGGANAAALTGSLEAMGGVGKTCVALEYLHRFGTREWQGGLFWINAEQDAELQLYDVLRALDPNTPDIAAIRQIPGGVYEKVARVIRALEGPRPLFVIDNVPEPGTYQQPTPLATWCPLLGEVPVLSTSRRRVSAGRSGSITPLRIQPLDPEAAELLLTREILRNSLSDAEWKQIADWVGHLPLALKLLNGLLSSGAMNARAVLEMSRAERPSEALDRGMKAIRPSVEPGALRGITEAFSASYNLLTSEQQYAARLIAWMAPEPIPEFVLKAFGPDVFTPSVRATLRDRSFVTEARDGFGEYFGAMHRVLADFVRSRSMAVDKEISFVASILKGLIDFAAGRGDAGSRLVRATAPLLTAFNSHRLTTSADSQRFLESFWFGIETGNALLAWGFPELAAYLWNIVSYATERRLGEEHPHALGVRSEIARALSDRGDHAGAQQLQERVLKARRRVLGEEHPNTLASMNNLAATLSARGDLAGAQELQERVLEAMRRSLGEEHPDTLASMNNLALTLSDRGDHAGAQELQGRVLEAMRRILGEEHPNTLASMNNLAKTMRARGDHAGAQELQERVLEARRRILGEEHPDTLVSMNNLASSLSDRGDHAGAQALQERVLEASRRILGEEHPDTLVSMNNLASTLSDRGDHAGAQALQERVLEARRRILGEEHPDTLVSMNNLAATLSDRGDHAGAQALLERVLEASRRILGEEHPDTLVSMNNLAAMLSHRGDHAGAQALLERALEAMRQRLGVEHPWATITAWGLLRTYLAQDDLDAANRVLNESLAWMFDRDTGSLAGQQRQILEALEELIRASSEEDETGESLTDQE